MLSSSEPGYRAEGALKLNSKPMGLLLDRADEGEHRRIAGDADLPPVRLLKGPVRCRSSFTMP
jgi:hypothetical protein